MRAAKSSAARRWVTFTLREGGRNANKRLIHRDIEASKIVHRKVSSSESRQQGSRARFSRRRYAAGRGGDGEACLHQLRRCCHGNLALAERRSEGLGSSSGRRRCLPILERIASEGAERGAGNKMALNVERVIDDGVNG